MKKVNQLLGTEIKERPILFSSEMVRAVLEGRKTQTRRVLPMKGKYNGVAWVTLREWLPNKNDQRGDLIGCRYGKAGDLLWVREAICVEIGATKADVECGHFTYKADDLRGLWTKENGYRTIPSIHAPRFTSRITLRIKEVRAERLQKITPAGIEAEGTPAIEGFIHHRFTGQRKKDFIYLWNSINEKRGYSWDSNPWVWVIEFSKVAS